MKICLGTAQFGNKYGINNKTGTLTKKQVFEILDYAVDNGIYFFDTSPLYGDAEKILGEYIKSNNLSDKVNIISKYKNSDTNINETINNLYINKLYAYLLHDPSILYDSVQLNNFLLKCGNMCKKIGISIYSPADAINSIAFAQCIQIPFNILDWRLSRINFFSEANFYKTEIFARSIFLQGLLLMDLNEIPLKFQKIIPFLEAIDTAAARYNYSRFEILFRFVYENPSINYIVVGIDDLIQLKQIIDIIKDISIFNIKIDELIYFLMENDLPESILNPCIW